MPNQSRKYEQAIAALLSTRTLEQAAKMARIGLRTLKSWLTREDFQREYDRAKGELLRDATLRLRKEATESVGVLAAIRRNRKTPPASRVSASIALVRLALDAEAQESIIQRLEKLEAQNDEAV